MMNSTMRFQRGFSLVELMVGMTVGVILLSAVVALTVSVLRTNAETVTVAKLTQEGRAIGDLFSRELRRARYSGNYRAFVGAAGSIPNVFSNVDILGGGNCIRFSYDADDDGVLDANEVKVISLENGAVYFAQFSTYAGATCGSANALRISSPDVRVANLAFARNTGVNANPNRIDLTFRLALVNDSAITRRFDQAVQIRNPFL
jgi:prepilin peptidase dependent protein B